MLFLLNCMFPHQNTTKFEQLLFGGRDLIRGYLMRGLSSSPFFQFLLAPGDTMTGGLEILCSLTFVKKEKNITDKIPDLLTKRKAETARKLDANVLFLLNCMFPHQNTSWNNCCSGGGGYLIKGRAI